MKYYLISEQEVKEWIWNIEFFIHDSLMEVLDQHEFKDCSTEMSNHDSENEEE